VNATTGVILWSKALPGSFLPDAWPVVANGTLYVGDKYSVLHALNAATGETVWALETSEGTMDSSPCVVDSGGAVYHAGDSGNHQ
jgi:outer membrane protein assembly factor BamB